MIAETTQLNGMALTEVTILDALRTRKDPFAPADLISQLVGSGFHDSDIRAAIWYLLDRHVIRLTVDLRLSLPAALPGGLASSPA